ncbi:MAG: hypothetical protein ACT4OZ_15955 [Gemmatimonadota bacterium]
MGFPVLRWVTLSGGWERSITTLSARAAGGPAIVSTDHEPTRFGWALRTAISGRPTARISPLGAARGLWVKAERERRFLWSLQAGIRFNVRPQTRT